MFIYYYAIIHIFIIFFKIKLQLYFLRIDFFIENKKTIIFKKIF